MFGPQNQVEADKEEDRRWENVFHLCEPPIKRSAQAQRWGGGGHSGLIHYAVPQVMVKSLSPGLCVLQI
jgi:hypothetical protein